MTISIILPIYQRAHTLRRCLESIHAQTFQDWEVIGVDDGSTDDSAGVFLQDADARFRLIRHEHNRGPSAARNTALAVARGEFVALIDSDDEWLPDKLERQLAFLGSSEADGCGCEYWRVGPGETTHHRLPEPASWVEELHFRCELTGSTLLARRACLETIGPMDEALRLYEDWEWMLRFTERFRYVVLHEPLARYYTGGPRNPDAMARSVERFLALREADLRRRGLPFRARVRGVHFENAAVHALQQRRFALGLRYLLKSVGAAPLRRPTLLAALPLAALDALLGSALLSRAAGWPTNYV